MIQRVPRAAVRLPLPQPNSDQRPTQRAGDRNESRVGSQRSIRFGQPPKITPEIEAEMEKLLLDNEPISLIAKRYKVAVATVRSRFNGDRLAAIRAKAARRGKRSGR